MRSNARPSVYAWQLSHVLQGSPSFGSAQFNAFARSRPVVVLPVPRGPLRRYACATFPEATAFVSVRTTPSCPATSAKVRGRHLR